MDILTREEIIELNNQGALLLVANQYVYDAQAFLNNHAHPGGNIFATAIKRYEQDDVDATQDHQFHSRRAQTLWKQYCVGKLDTNKYACILL